MSWCWVNIGNWCFDDDISIDDHWCVVDDWLVVCVVFYDDWLVVCVGFFDDNRLYIGVCLLNVMVFRFWNMNWCSNNIRVGVMSWISLAWVRCLPL